jgi:hypothetical protein
MQRSALEAAQNPERDLFRDAVYAQTVSFVLS